LGFTKYPFFCWRGRGAKRRFYCTIQMR